MMKNEKVIMYDSPEAASIKTVTGWVSSNGQFFGGDEHLARFCGSTHKVCKCGDVIARNGYCRKCHEQKKHDQYMAMPSVPWDGEAVLSIHDTDVYFFSADSLIDYCVDNGCRPQDLPLVICVPKFASEIDGSDYFSSHLPEDGELPAEIEAAFDALNAVIRACKEPLCWYQGKTSVTPESLPTIEVEQSEGDACPSHEK